MADIADELKTYLKTITNITNLIGVGTAARIYPTRPAKPVALPYIVFEVFEGSSAEHLDGISGIAKNRIQLDAYAATSGAAHALAEKIRLAPLQMYRGLMGSTFVNNTSSNGGYRRGSVPPVKGGHKLEYWVSRDYMITYSEPTS